MFLPDGHFVHFFLFKILENDSVLQTIGVFLKYGYPQIIHISRIFP